MAELESDDSSDGTLVIDEPNYDYETIEIVDDSDSDIEIVELSDDAEDTSSILNLSTSSSKFGLTCKLCFRKFSTNNDLINHIRKFKGRLGGCNNETNINIRSTIKRKKSENLTSEDVYKKKQNISPKLPVPKSIPVAIYPPMEPITFNPVPHTNGKHTNINNANDNLPSLRQMLLEETDPEHPCTHCGQIFRHYIGLVCHLNSDHSESSNKVTNTVKSSTTSGKKKRIARKSVIKEKKQYEKCIIENDEPVSNTVDLTLSSDSKKDSVLNRMKSYVCTSSKGVVICVLCHKKFPNTKKALTHVEDKHITNKIECGYCNMKFVYELKLRSHMAKRHKVICVYKCDKCLKMINKEECESHLAKCKGHPLEIKSEEVTVIV